jgi:hypothetical protein
MSFFRECGIGVLSENDDHGIFDDVICEDGHTRCSTLGESFLVSAETVRELREVRSLLDRSKLTDVFDRFGISSLGLNGADCKAVDDGGLSIVFQKSEGTVGRELANRLQELFLKLNYHGIETRILSCGRLGVAAVGVSKRAAVEQCGIDLAHAILFCDGPNDIILARRAVELGGCVVCPSTAIPELRQIATFVSRRKSSFGVADFLQNSASLRNAKTARSI